MCVNLIGQSHTAIVRIACSKVRFKVTRTATPFPLVRYIRSKTYLSPDGHNSLVDLYVISGRMHSDTLAMLNSTTSNGGALPGKVHRMGVRRPFAKDIFCGGHRNNKVGSQYRNKVAQ